MANAYWGPYLPNRDWGTVRKDSSLDGNRFKAILHDNVVKRERERERERERVCLRIGTCSNT